MTQNNKLTYMKYNMYQHILLPVGALLLVAAMFVYYAPEADAPTDVDEKRGCIASAYQSSRHAGSTLEANLKVCDEL